MRIKISQLLCTIWLFLQSISANDPFRNGYEMDQYWSRLDIQLVNLRFDRLQLARYFDAYCSKTVPVKLTYCSKIFPPLFDETKFIFQFSTHRTFWPFVHTIRNIEYRTFNSEMAKRLGFRQCSEIGFNWPSQFIASLKYLKFRIVVKSGFFFWSARKTKWFNLYMPSIKLVQRDRLYWSLARRIHYDKCPKLLEETPLDVIKDVFHLLINNNDVRAINHARYTRKYDFDLLGDDVVIAAFDSSLKVEHHDFLVKKKLIFQTLCDGNATKLDIFDGFFLKECIRRRKTGVFKMLLQLHADPNVANGAVILYASFSEAWNFYFNLLKKYNGDFMLVHDLLIQNAYFNRNNDMLSWLLNHGFDPTINNGMIIYDALASSRGDVIRMFVRSKVNFDLTQTYLANSSLIAAVKQEHNITILTSALMNFEAKSVETSIDMGNALIIASRMGYTPAILKLLCSQGPDPSFFDKFYRKISFDESKDDDIRLIFSKFGIHEIRPTYPKYLCRRHRVPLRQKKSLIRTKGVSISVSEYNSLERTENAFTKLNMIYNDMIRADDIIRINNTRFYNSSMDYNQTDLEDSFELDPNISSVDLQIATTTSSNSKSEKYSFFESIYLYFFPSHVKTRTTPDTTRLSSWLTRKPKRNLSIEIPDISLQNLTMNSSQQISAELARLILSHDLHLNETEITEDD